MRPLTILALAALLTMPWATRAQTRFSVSTTPLRIDNGLEDSSPILLEIARAGKTARSLFAGDRVLVLRDGDRSRRWRAEGKIIATSVSESGRFVASLVLSDDDQRETQRHLVMLDGDLSARYTIPLPSHPDDPLPNVILDDSDGSAVVLYHAQGRSVFLSPDGGERVVQNLTDRPYDIERTVVAGRASRSGVLALAVNDPAGDGLRSVAAERVRLFDYAGAERGGFDLPPRAVSSLGVSPDGGLVVVGSYDADIGIFQTLFFKDSGQELFRADLSAERVHFDDSGEIVLISDKRRLLVVSPESGRILLDIRLTDGRERLFDVDLSADGRYVLALAGTSSFREGKFVLEDLRISEFLRKDDGEFAAELRTLDGSAHSVAVDIEETGVAVSLDDEVMTFNRP